MTNYEHPTPSSPADEEHAWDAWPTLFEHVIGLQDIDVDPVDGFDEQAPALTGLCCAQSTIKVFHNQDGNNTGETFDTLSKADRIAKWLLENLPHNVKILVGSPVPRTELAETHSREYLDALVTGDPEDLATSSGMSWDEQLWHAVIASTGSVRAAALAAWAGRTVAGATSSGLHHARYDRGAGYCTLNGLVVAAKAVLAAGARRVLVVDFDAHCGGGTASLIEGVDGIEQVDVSVFRFDSYESRPDAPLEVVGADDYLDAVRRALEAVADPGSVDLVIYNAGMDPHEWAGGVSGITTSVMRQRDRMVMEWAEAHDLPVAFVMAGGYQGGTWDLDDVAALHGVTFDEALRSLDRRAAA
jgi:acetoin utilization deacetylase AcuC-like enzyme